MPFSVQKNQANSEEATILSRLAAEVGDSLFALWFSSPDCIQVVGKALRVYANSDFELRRIQRGYASLIRRIGSEVLGFSVTMEFVLRDIVPAEPEIVDKPSILLRPHRSLKIKNQGELQPAGLETVTVRAPVRPRYLLREFSFGIENEFTKAAIKQVLQFTGHFSPLLIYGGSGSGKTHLLEALTGELRATQRRNSIYLTAEQFTSSFVHALRGGGLPVFRRKYRDVDVLAIDDVHFFANKRATISEFQYTIDHLARAGKQVVLSSDRPPIELVDLGPEILNRMNSGLVCPLYFAGLESRRGIVKRFCLERGLVWGDDIMELIAQKVGRDARKISGAINRISAAAMVKNQIVNIELVEEALSQSVGFGKRMASISLIEKVICEYFSISVSEIRSSSRIQKVSNARMMAMFMCRKYSSAALSEIGEHFGGRSHSTVIASVRRIDEMIAENSEILLASGHATIQEIVGSLENKLRLN